MRATSVLNGRPLSSASASPRGAGPPLAAASHHNAGTGGSLAPRFPQMPSLTADDTTVPTAPASATRAASFPLDVTVYTAAGANVAAASAADIDMEVGTGSVPITATLPDADHISSFLSYIRRCVADDATATAASATETLATPPSPDVNADATEGATASAAFAATASPDYALGSSDISVFSHESAVTADDAADGSTAVEPSGGSRKRRRARPHKSRDARRSCVHDGRAPTDSGGGAHHGTDG